MPELRRLLDIAQVPWEVLEYERWVTQASGAGTDDYLFAEAKPRFEAVDTDRLVVLPDLQVQGTASTAKLHAPSLGTSLDLKGVGREAASKCLDGLREGKRVAEVRSQHRELDAVLRQTLGLLVFAPESLADLEHRLPGTELVRFVGTPYEIVRSYWENAADARALAQDELSRVQDSAGFLELLRAMHVVTLMGRRLDRFYRPVSKIAASGVRPGALFEADTRTLNPLQGEMLLLSGPRVGANLVGGELYFRLVIGDAGPDAGGEAEKSSGSDATATAEWGRVVSARAPHEPKPALWFLPPRPLTASHFEALWSAVEAARAARDRADWDELHRALARFHYRFARLHPFRCANQSLSMNLVNMLLSASGGGIPHLLLDHFAFHVSEAAYLAVFCRALEAHRSLLAEPAARRWHGLRHKKALSYGLVERLQKAATPAAALEECRAAPEAARAALIAPAWG